MFSEKNKKELQSLKNRKIIKDDPDASEISDWLNIEQGKFYRPIKKQITLRIDADVLNWFKSHNGYQTMINALCREYYLKHLFKKRKK